MACGRCGGLLQRERVHWRSRHHWLACHACGDRIDETILANRRCMVRRTPPDWKARLWERVKLLASLKEVPA